MAAPSSDVDWGVAGGASAALPVSSVVISCLVYELIYI